MLLPRCFSFKCVCVCPSCLLPLPALVVSLSCVPSCCCLPAHLHVRLYCRPCAHMSLLFRSLIFRPCVSFLLLLSCLHGCCSLGASLGACASLHLLVVFLFLFLWLLVLLCWPLLSCRPCMFYICPPLTAVILRCAGSSSLLLFISIVCASLLLFVFGFESLSFLFFVDLACTFLAAISLLPLLSHAHSGSSIVVTRYCLVRISLVVCS